MSDPIYIPSSSAPEYRLGDWVLCVRTNSLRRLSEDSNICIELENRLVLLLLFFMENANKVVTRDLILSAIWKGKVVNHDSLAVAISHLRKALGDDSRAPQYIKTLPGIGYQFIASCHPLESDHCGFNKENSIDLAHEKRSTSKDKQKSRQHLVFVLFAIIVVVLLAVIGMQSQEFHQSLSKSESSAETISNANSLPESAAKVLLQVDSQLLSNDSSQWLSAIENLRHLLKGYPNLYLAYFKIAEAKMKLLGTNLTLKENCEEVIGLLDKTLQLNKQFTPALIKRGDVYFWCQHNYIEAENYYKMAIALDSQNDLAPMQHAQLLLALGRFSESLEQVDQARKLNPLNYPIPMVVWIYQMQRKDDLALQELTRINSAEPENRYFHISAQRVYARTKQEEASFNHLLWLMKDVGYSVNELEEVKQIFVQGKLTAVNHWLLKRKETKDLGQYTPPLSWARYALASGEGEQAITYLQQAFAAKQVELLWANVDPAYDLVREDKRFQMMIDKFWHINPES